METIQARLTVDRRRKTFLGSLRGLFLARRRARRRRADEHVHVDHFHLAHLPWAFGIPLFCAADCFWTINILVAGGQEVNPVMRSLIEFDILAFAIVKMMLTVGCVMFLLLHEHIRLLRRVPVAALMYTLLLGYMALFVYQVQIIGMAHGA